MNSMHTITLNAVTILSSNEWPQFKPVLDQVIREKRLKKYILAISGDKHTEEISLFAMMYKEKLQIVNGSTLTPSLLFIHAILEVQKYPSDYVIIFDSESIPQEGWIDAYLDNLKFFKEKDIPTVIMIGNTIDIFGKEKSYYSIDSRKNFRDGTLFDILNFHKISTLLRQVFHIQGSSKSNTHIFKTSSSIGGGTLIPFEALRVAAAPNKDLVIYGEDTDYAWKLKEAGYSFFQCLTPILRKPSSEKDTSNHVLSLFSSHLRDSDAYYRIRNSVLISREHTQQSKPILFINIVLWITLATIFGFWETTSFRLFFRRVKVIILGAFHGYMPSKNIPSSILL